MTCTIEFGSRNSPDMPVDLMLQQERIQTT